MKQYIFTVTINEGSDEFWEELNKEHKDGIKEITEDIQSMLEVNGYVDSIVKLKQYTLTEKD